MDDPITEHEITPAVSENSKHASWMKQALMMVRYLLSLFLTGLRRTNESLSGRTSLGAWRDSSGVRPGLRQQDRGTGYE
jgi:hypothetical protein